jgi:hypothetical protein
VFDPAGNATSESTSAPPQPETQEPQPKSEVKSDEGKTSEPQQEKDPVAILRLNSGDFEIYFSKGMNYFRTDYSTVKKLDGSRVFAQPNQIKGQQVFCPLFLTSDFSKEQTVVLNATLPIVLQTKFKEMGVASSLSFEPKECIANDRSGLRIAPTTSPILVVQKKALNQVARLYNFNLYEEGAELSGNVIAQEAEKVVRQEVERQKELTKRKELFSQLASAKSKEQIGSLTLSYPDKSGPLKICARKDPDARFRLAVLGYFATDDLRLSKAFLDKSVEVKSTIDRSKPITSAFNDLDDFYVNFQKDSSLCQVLIDYPENLQTIANEVGEGKYEINPLISIEEARNDAAKRRGYADVESYEFAREIEANADTIKRLSDLGIKNREDFKAAVARMQKQKYADGSSSQEVLSFLEDEKAGAPKKISATAVRDARVKQQRAEAALREKREREERAAYAKKFPYYAVLSCGFGNSNMAVIACFAGGRSSADTEIKFTQNSVQRVYKVYEIANNAVGRNQQDGLYIDLPKSHYLVAQNASDTLTLRLRVYDRLTGKLLSQKEAGSLYGVVSSRK